jgi:Ca2+-binding EF-hand superfamily protein
MVEATKSYTIPFAFKKVFSPEECTSLERTFKAYDKDKSGSINAKEFKQVCKDLGHGDVTEELLKSLFEKADKNNDSVIDWEEYLTMMLSVFQKNQAAFGQVL